jgi:parallel beta-helix repeat protein
MKKIISLFLILSLIFTLTPIIQKANQLNKEIIYVDDDNTQGPWDGTYFNPYKSINDGINNSGIFDTIYVFMGQYNETLQIKKTIKLVGEDKESTIINGRFFKNIVEISSENVSLENFLFRNSGGFSKDAGIQVNSKNCKIKNCIIYNTKTGIFVNHTENIEINNNTLQNNGEGILIDSSSSCTIIGSCFSNNAIALRFDNSRDCDVFYTYFHTNGIASLINNSEENRIQNCIIKDNSANLGGIFISASKNILINNSIINHNGAGFSIYSSSKINISNCDLCLNTHFGLSMRTASDEVSIKNCEINDNFRYAIYVEDYNSLKISNNNIERNKLYGLYSTNSNCDARKNYWGSSFGPALFEFRKASQISFPFLNIKFFPWSLKRIENIGAKNAEIEPYINCKAYFVPTRKIMFEGKDTDIDGVPDWWEEIYGYNTEIAQDHENLDPDHDGLNNIEECYTYSEGSNPFKKDIFLEIDWMRPMNFEVSNIPPNELIDELIDIFEAQEINLHVNLSEELEYILTCSSFALLRDIYWNYFLHNDLNNPRKGIYRYCLVCNYCPDLNFPFFGWDNLDSCAISADLLQTRFPLMSRGRLITGAAVHHLGHSLGLLSDTFEGIDNIKTTRIFSFQKLKYKNYFSCMHYGYKYKILSFSDGSHGIGDFDDWSNLDFTFFKDSHFEWPKD